MPKVKPPKFSRPNVLKKVKAEHLLALLAPHREYLASRGFAWPPTGQPIEYDQLADVLAVTNAATPPELVDQLHLVDLLADDQQTFDFESEYAALVRKLQKPDDSPADVALKILLDSPDVAWRAFDRHALKVKRSMASFLADEAKAFHEPTKERLKKLEVAMAPWFQDSNRSDVCRVHAMRDEEMWAFVIRHGDPIARIGIITEKGESSSALFRPERLDVAFFNPKTREWLISGGSRLLKEMYQEKLGAVLHGSKHALSRSDRYTLEPLHRGPEVLAESGVEAVRTAGLKEVTIVLPSGVEMSLKKGDVFAALVEQQRLVHGAAEVVQATFGLMLSHRRRWLHVTITPGSNSVSGAAGIGVVDAWLEDRGFVITNANVALLAGS